MPLRLFNMLTRKKEVFKPARGKTARFYACGPTVYDYVHIGNLRTFIFEDVLYRALALNGYKVKMASTEFETYSVDTPEDLKRVDLLMQSDVLMRGYR